MTLKGDRKEEIIILDVQFEGQQFRWVVILPYKRLKIPLPQKKTIEMKLRMKIIFLCQITSFSHPPRAHDITKTVIIHIAAEKYTLERD